MHIKGSTRRISARVLSGRRRWRRLASRGSAFVEAAFVSLPFVLILIGIIDCGQFLFIHQALVERARYAARWGAVTDPTDMTAVQNMVLYNQPTTPPTPTGGYFGLKSSMVQVTNPDPSSDDYRLVVAISNYQYRVFSPLIGGAYTGPRITVAVPLGLTN